MEANLDDNKTEDGNTSDDNDNDAVETAVQQADHGHLVGGEYIATALLPY
jgi:hypothetical protein